MKNITPPAMKPVLVTEVSDDIRKVRGTDVAQQQTLLTARAMQDLLAGDLISLNDTSAFDRRYIKELEKEETGEKYRRIDLDLIVDPSIRFVERGSYIHGPKYAYDKDDSTKTNVVQAGILHTYAQLPDGQLTWDDDYWRGTTSIPGPSAAKDDAPTRQRGEINHRHPREGAMSRQIFYANNASIQDTNSFTRVGVYRGYDSATDTEIYEWGEWARTSGEKTYIIVTDETVEEVVNPIVNSIYSVHTSISEFKLPEASKLACGTSITIIQYPDPDANDRSLWATLVTYTPADGSDPMRIILTPAPIRNTAKKDEAYLEGLSPTEYEFVVVPVIDKESKIEVGRTWELQVDAEASDFTTGITELLAAHTEPGVNDVVDYSSRRYREEDPTVLQGSTEPLAITRAMMASGFVNGSVTKFTDLLAAGWNIVVKKITVVGDDNPNFVVTSDVFPDERKLYFVKRANNSTGEVSYQLAIDPDFPDLEPGHLNPWRGNDKNYSFPVTGAEYYELANGANLVTEDIMTLAGGAMAAGQTTKFRHYFNRHDLLYVVITPATSQSHVEARNNVTVVIGFVPDPHPGVYIPKQCVNPSAYTSRQFNHAASTGAVYVREGDGMSNTPASTEALVNAYDDLAGRLQARGLLTGIIDAGRVDGVALDGLRQTGLYCITPDELDSVPASGGYPQGVTAEDQAKLIVIGGETASSTMRNEEDQYVETTDSNPVTAKTYYVWNKGSCAYELAPAAIAGKPTTFAEEYKPYYEMAAVPYKVNGSNVTQILMQLGSRRGMWVREYDQSARGWTTWMKINLGKVVRTFTNVQSVPSIEIDGMLKLGDPVLVIKNIASSAVTTVSLPDATSYPYGAEIKIVADGSPTARVTFQYRDGAGATRIYTAKLNPDMMSVSITAFTDGMYWLFKREELNYGTSTI